MAAALPKDGWRRDTGGSLTREERPCEEERCQEEQREEIEWLPCFEDAAPYDCQFAEQGSGARGARTLEGEVPGSCVTSCRRRHPRRFDARPLVDVDAHSRQPAACAGGRSSAARDSRSRRRPDTRVAWASTVILKPRAHARG